MAPFVTLRQRRFYDAQIRICGGPGWATTQVYPAREAVPDPAKLFALAQSVNEVHFFMVNHEVFSLNAEMP